MESGRGYGVQGRSSPLAEESGFCCLLAVKQRLGAMGQFEGEAANWLPNGVHAILPPLSGHGPLPAPSFHSGHMETKGETEAGQGRVVAYDGQQVVGIGVQLLAYATPP